MTGSRLRARTGALLVSITLTLACGEERPDVPALASEAEPLTLADPHVLHRTRAGTVCSDCHAAHGGMMGTALISFSERARLPSGPAPTLNADFSCSNVACHAVPAGTYTYWAMGGDGEPYEETFSYGGVPVRTPPWGEATSDGCRACHGNPPSPATSPWHSGRHGNTLGGALNACTLCHRGVEVVNGTLALRTANDCGPNGTAGSCEALHRNGVADVSARFVSSCFGCH